MKKQIKKLSLLINVYFLTALSFAGADVIKLECEGTYQNKKEALKLKIDENSGLVQEWSQNYMAKHIAGDYVEGLCQDTSTYGYEWTNNFRASSNQATILEMGTTADSFKIAIASDFKKATFRYSDLGSGNGNHQFELTCTKL